MISWVIIVPNWFAVVALVVTALAIVCLLALVSRKRRRR